jgi:hypothetical protein
MSIKYLHRADYIKVQLLKSLLDGGFGFHPPSGVIGNEVLFSTNRRRCDLLAMGQFFHAFEVKGIADNLTKLPNQITDYQKTFDFVSVITTPKHFEKTIRIVPSTVGIAIAGTDFIEVTRQPKQQKCLNKDSLLMFMKRQCLLAFLRQQNIRCTVPLHSLTIHELRDFTARKCSVTAIRAAAYKAVKDAYYPLFGCFIREIENYPILIDDIRLLSLEISLPRSFSGGCPDGE